MNRIVKVLAGLLVLTAASCGDGGGGGEGKHGAGLSCASSADCAAGLICALEDPGGQCIKTCTPGDDATCGDSRFVCGFEGHCYFKCAVTPDCMRATEGYVCKDDTPPRSVKFCDVP